jgi:hypothetical protein
VLLFLRAQPAAGLAVDQSRVGRGWHPAVWCKGFCRVMAPGAMWGDWCKGFLRDFR